MTPRSSTEYGYIFRVGSPAMATKRRGWGEGAIYRRGDGRLTGSVELGRDHRGRRRRKVVYGKTKQEVLTRLYAARRERGQGLDPVDERLTTAAWLDRWLAVLCGDISPGSRETYTRAVRIYIQSEIGHIRLAQLTPALVERMTRAIRERGPFDEHGEAGSPRAPGRLIGGRASRRRASKRCRDRCRAEMRRSGQD